MSPQDTCDFCGLSEGTETTGELQSTLDGSVVAHHNCMLYSPLVIQKDSQEDTEGFGFDIDSVLSEIDRGQKLRCSHCKKRGATVGCDVRSCKKSYHYPCLIRAKGSPIPHKFIVHCDKHKNLSEAKDSGRLQRTKKRKKLQKATRKLRNKNIRNRHDNDDSEPWQRDRKRTKLQNTSGRARNSDIRNQHDYNVDPQTAIMQNIQTGDQQETTFLLAIHSAVEIEDSEEALPSSSGQPMSSGTNSEESESLLNPKVKDSFSLSGFPKRKKKYTLNRKPSKQDSPKLQEILQKITSEEKKELSQIYSELGGSESYLTTEMDVTSDNQNGEMTTDNPMNTDVTETSTCSDSSEGEKTPERLPEINVQGTLTEQFRSFVPQLQSTINCQRRNTATSGEQNGDGQAISKGSPKPTTSDQQGEVIELRRLRNSQGWIEKSRQSRRLQSVKTLPTENKLREPLRNRGTSDDPIRKKDLLCLEKKESKRKLFQDSDELLPNMLPQQAEVKPPKQQEIPENQDDDTSTEESLLEETETPRSEVNEPVLGHYSGPSERITPVRRRLNSLFARNRSQRSFQHERVEDLDDMDGFALAVAGQCRQMPVDRQAKYMSYVFASAHLFRSSSTLPKVEVLIANLQTELDRFQESSSCGAYGSSD
ncbi:uncharacterized protein LOC143817033 isoform X5 [Ranitomeya variabilis]|uniref:uncharacterized protein LOC143817033 isoform X5 n=1 Tax=Ranitomeya variabilis TaxID=490064 RepID=UPI0040571C71